MRIAALCAANPGNAGMLSVDLASTDFLLPLGVEVRHYITQKKNMTDREFGGIHFSYLGDRAALSAFDRIIYWGDFQNNPAYGAGDFADRDVMFKLSLTRDAAFDRWKSIYCQPDKAPGQRVISVGNNLQHDLSGDGRLRGAMEVFLASADAVLPRDEHSLKNASRHAAYDDLAKLSQGMDCAFLLDPLARERKADHFTYFFGRSGFADIDGLIRQIERATGLTGINLDDWHKLRPRTALQTFTALRKDILRSRFLISDTYHACINAMTLGVSVIGLGKGVAQQSGTLGDFKKRELFNNLGIGTRYAELPSLKAEHADPVIQTCVALKASDYDDVEGHDAIQAQIAQFRRKIVNALRI